jgi:hypothetical protein
MRVSHFWFYFVRLDRIVIAVALFRLPFRAIAGQAKRPFTPQYETTALLAHPVNPAVALLSVHSQHSSLPINQESA